MLTDDKETEKGDFDRRHDIGTKGEKQVPENLGRYQRGVKIWSGFTTDSHEKKAKN